MNRTIHLAAGAVLGPGEAPDVAFVPPLVRRRLSPLQKIYFALAHAVGGDAPMAAVFASRDGEDTLTRRLVEAFHVDGSVSPNRFSTSVYNAAPGLWSIQSESRAPYTAIAAGDETVECGLLEALAAEPMLFVTAEETDGGYGAAVRFAAEPGALRIRVSDGDPAREPIAFGDWADFVTGRRSTLAGRWLTLETLV